MIPKTKPPSTVFVARCHLESGQVGLRMQLCVVANWGTTRLKCWNRDFMHLLFTNLSLYVLDGVI